MRTKEEIEKRLEALTLRDRFGLGGSYATAIAELQWVLGIRKGEVISTNETSPFNNIDAPVVYERGACSL